MITILSIVFLIFCIWAMIKIIPTLLGFTFTLFLTLLQIVGILLLIPMIGMAFFIIDALFIGLIIGIAKLFV